MKTRNVVALASLVAGLGMNACAPKEEQRTPISDVASLDTMPTPLAPSAMATPAPVPSAPAVDLPAPTKAARTSARPVASVRTVPDTAPAPASTAAPTPAQVAPTPTSAVAVPAPVTPPAPVRAATRGQLTLQPGSRLWFDGTSNVKDFTCKSSTLAATVVTAGADAAPAIVAGTKSVTSVEFSVPVSSLDCDNGTMNGHMRKALEMEKHPEIRFALSSYDLAKDATGVAVTLVGSLTIRGAPQSVTMLAQATPGADGGLHLVGSYELNMKDYGVKPPSLMLNTMKVREKVKVRFDLVLKD